MLVGADCGFEITGGGSSDDTEQHYSAGIKLGDQGQPDAAITEFDEAIRLHPNYPQAYAARGFYYDELGQYQRAIEDYNVPISFPP